MHQNFTKFYWYEICIELKCVRFNCIVQLEFHATTTTNETQRTESHFPNQDYADDIFGTESRNSEITITSDVATTWWKQY